MAVDFVEKRSRVWRTASGELRFYMQYDAVAFNQATSAIPTPLDPITHGKLMEIRGAALMLVSAAGGTTVALYFMPEQDTTFASLGTELTAYATEHMSFDGHDLPVRCPASGNIGHMAAANYGATDNAYLRFWGTLTPLEEED